ncbi:carbohydrate ABC transporter permease [Vallitalea guaymasensis]|uniref:carbohydrate ABC transporter permease n=1 Tax=Vallitalea guaymasensis TaxID=1185412 RepID=UPI00272AD053|nr:carbohydrate ABC transporter permease [Vallitalea guaymasensis]
MSVVKKKRITYRTWINLYFIIMSITFILPFLLIVSASLTNEDILAKEGFKIIPPFIDWTGYKFVFSNVGEILRAYAVTTFQAFFGTFLSVLVMTLCAYPLSRKDFKFRKPITFFVFFTMLFNGGLIPTYLLNYKYLHLGNTIWIYILPTLCSAFYIIIFRTFFQGLPISLVESAKLDGASELRIFFQIILPLSKPVLATVALLTLLTKWNDWYTSLIYITDSNLYTLQFLLKRILQEVEFLRFMANNTPPGIDLSYLEDMPVETLKFAMCIIAAGPMLLVFPFFQKYFAKGLTVGSVKG